jgi:hypothetical protein
VLDVLAALEHENAQTFLGELLGGPSSGNPGPHDYRIVLRLLHQVLAVDCVTSSAVSPQRVEKSTGVQEYGRGGRGAQDQLPLNERRDLNYKLNVIRDLNYKLNVIRDLNYKLNVIRDLRSIDLRI